MPKIISVNNIAPTGTVGYGDLAASFAEIEAKLGSPGSSFDNYKTDAEWVIEYSDGSIATIYNWKNGKNYLGDLGLSVCDITDWRIGGTKEEVVRWVSDLIHNSWPIFDEIRQESQI